MPETRTEGERRRELDRGLRTILLSRFGEMPGERPGPPRRPRRPFSRTILLILAALPLFFGALACVALMVQTVRELGATSGGTGSPDWVLVLAACFFGLMVLALIGTGIMVLRVRASWLPTWIAMLVIGLGGAVLGAQQLAAADWRAFSVAGGGAAIFLALSLYLAVVSGVGLRLKARRELFDDEG